MGDGICLIAVRDGHANISWHPSCLEVCVSAKVDVSPIVLIGKIAYPECRRQPLALYTGTRVEGRVAWYIEICLGREIARLLVLICTVNADKAINVIGD